MPTLAKGNRQVNFSIPVELWEAAVAKATAESKPISTVIRESLEKYTRKKAGKTRAKRTIPGNT